MTTPREFSEPDYTDLRPYLPALEAGLRALQERGDELRGRFEPTGAELAVEAMHDLRELRDLIDTNENGAVSIEGAP